MKSSNTAGRMPASRRTAGRAQDTHAIDPYKARGKSSGPAVCAECGAVYEAGRWNWAPPPKAAEETICQACHRARDKFPAGILTIKGASALAQKAEILRLARHNEELEKKEHPLNRIMAIDEGADSIVISTTDIHLPRRIAESLRRAYHSDPVFDYDENSYFVRVTWEKTK
jgi:hypothetical protein